MDTCRSEDTEVSNRRPTACFKTFRKILRNNLGAILPLLAAMLAFAIGLPLAKRKIHPDILMWIELPGQLYLRGLLMLVLPLIVSCTICASSKTDLKSQGKLGGVVLGYSLAHDFIGSSIGVALAAAFKLGVKTSTSLSKNAEKKLAKLTPQDAFADLIRNLIPDNMVAAAFRSTQTRYDEEVTNGTVKLMRVVGTSGSPNIIGLLVVSGVVGLAASGLGKKAQSFLHFFEALQDVMLKVLAWFLWTTCVGVFSLVLGNLLQLDDPLSSIQDLAFLVLAMAIASVIVVLVLVPGSIAIATRKNPYRYFKAMLLPWVIAIGPPSPWAAYPAHLVAAKKWRLSSDCVNFSLPLYIIMDKAGSAAFVSMSTVMMANMSGSPPSTSDYLVILFLTGFLMVAAPTVPSGSLVTILIVLSSVSLPSSYLGLLFVVEWLLDRMRVGVNVVSQLGGIIFADGIVKKERGNGLDEEDAVGINTVCKDEKKDILSEGKGSLLGDLGGDTGV